MSKFRVGVIFGGKSAEHEVSVRSAQNVIAAIPRDKYEVVPIWISREGQWLAGGRVLELGSGPAAPGEGDAALTIVPDRDGARIVELEKGSSGSKVDVVFPVLHGPFGEDGTVQGLLKLAGIPFVGSGVLGSAVGMDKDVMKRLLREAGLPVGKFLCLTDSAQADFERARRELGLPVFVKPANLGSSVGVSKAGGPDEFRQAVRRAFEYDRKILVEEFIPGREIECSVLGNEEPIASLPGEVIPQRDFYSYEAKYLDENGALLEIPARLPEKEVREVQRLAVKAFQVLGAEGLARVDFFLRPDGGWFVNEINTLPGFTSISMYPKLWEASGMPYAELVDRLIQLALDRHARESRLKTSRA